MIALLLLALVSPLSVAQAVGTPRAIRVVMDDNYPPFVFQSDEGKLRGILIDQWRAWERKAGTQMVLTPEARV